MKLIFVLLLFIMLLPQVVLSQDFPRADQTAYVMPANIDIKLQSTGNGKVTALVLPLTGSPRNLKIRFISSSGIKVENTPLSLPNLSEELKFPVEFSVEKPEKNNWIKLLVEYNPDYSKLMKKITSSKKYPDPELKLNLIKKVKGLSQLHKKFTEAAFYRFNGEKIR
jgi:hypothetical protein